MHLAVAFMASLAPLFGDYTAPKPTAANLSEWTEYVQPSPEEIAHEAIPWRTTFASGLRDASDQAKPLLFWGMNGHPLGCT